MIEIVTKKELITKYQKRLIRQLKTACKEKIACQLGYKGNYTNVNTFYSKDYNFGFTSFNLDSEKRFWNAFVYGKPKENKNNSITVEINPPDKGINRRTGGAFGLNKEGEVFLLHRGKIGGGRENIGKQVFFKKYNGEPIVVKDGEKENKLFIVGRIGSKQLLKKVSTFVEQVYQIKEESRSPETYDIDNVKAIEGYQLDKRYLQIKRNQSIVKRRKRKDNYTCQICGFRLKVSGGHIIECHHIKALAGGNYRVTNIDELICLCPTCHRIVHIRKPQYTVQEVKALRKKAWEI